MKILSVRQIREADLYTIKNEPVSSTDLMERASSRASEWIFNRFGTERSFLVFAGRGNNGGDGLAMARILAGKGLKVKVFLSSFTGLSEDASVNLNRLKETGIVEIELLKGEESFPAVENSDIIIDALFGSGLSRPIEGSAAGTVKKINESGATVISVDIPSGLFGEDNTNNDPSSIVKAGYTLTFQLPKLSFFFRENRIYTGEWYVIPIDLHPRFIENAETPYFYMTGDFFKGLVKKREKFSHKGGFGHCLIISGSYGKMGAAVLAAKGCLRTGAGLVTVHSPANGTEIIQAAVPEAMVSIDESPGMITNVYGLERYSAVCAGPGIGTFEPTQKALEMLIGQWRNPVVLDADALNILSIRRELFSKLPPGSILTPHPGEFDRMAGESSTGYDRHLKQISFSREYGVYVVLKGAFTSVTTPEGECYFNSTGNPGMATAGSGDVLTGIIVSLLGQCYSPLAASQLGVYIHGLAGDIAAYKLSQQSIIAGDITDNIGVAFKKLNNS